MANSITFVRAGLNFLSELDGRNAYVGASNAATIDDFMAYILNKSSFGVGDEGHVRYCYLAYTRDALADR